MIRIAVVVLFWYGYAISKIHTRLKVPKLNRCFMQRTIKRYKESSNIDDWARLGHPWITQTRNNEAGLCLNGAQSTTKTNKSLL